MCGFHWTRKQQLTFCHARWQGLSMQECMCLYIHVAQLGEVINQTLSFILDYFSFWYSHEDEDQSHYIYANEDVEEPVNFQRAEDKRRDLTGQEREEPEREGGYGDSHTCMHIK